MRYDYETEKHKIFEEENQKLFLAIRDQVKAKIKIAGVVALPSAIALPDGIGAANSYTMIACVDRLVEIGELRKIEGDCSATTFYLEDTK